MKRLSIIVIICLLAVTSSPATYVVTTFLELSNRLYNLSAGDTVICTNGTYTWANELGPFTTPFTLRGEIPTGSNQCHWVSGAITYPLQLNPSSGITTVQYFDAIGHGNNDGGFITTGGNPPAAPTQGRCDIGNFQMTNCLARGVWAGFTDCYTRIHDCLIVTPTGASGFNHVAFGGNEYNSWTNSNPGGTSNLVEVSNFYFRNDAGNAGNGFFDGYNGASASLHDGVFDGTANTGVHGYDS